MFDQGRSGAAGFIWVWRDDRYRPGGGTLAGEAIHNAVVVSVTMTNLEGLQAKHKHQGQ